MDAVGVVEAVLPLAQTIGSRDAKKICPTGSTAAATAIWVLANLASTVESAVDASPAIM